MSKLQEYFQSLLNEANISFLLVIAIVVALCLLCGFIGKQFGKLEMSKDIRRQRKDAVKRSRAVLAGQVCEQIAPLLPDFPCDINNVQFVGRPVDFVGFCGDPQTGIVEEILFIEVKSASSVLSAREKSVKEAVEKHRVRYVEYRIQ